ncbi:hypothetical protein ACI3EY_12960 [Ornithinimicrobium sp. LYQ92]|uniref:hypothetical protein n=1 Tax=Serinicoccus sp. LYQ92 TaxID=3378798 RepID=UPI00385292AD
MTIAPSRSAPDPVEGFIRSYLTDPGLPFNADLRRGAHTPFVVTAAKRRGLRVVEVEEGFYFFDGVVCVGGIHRMVPTLCGSVASEVAKSKIATKTLLSEARVATPPWMVAGPDDYRAAADFMRMEGGPIVLKPSRGRGGSGVITGITNVTGLKEAWSRQRADRNFPLIAEKQVAGVDIRAYVVGGRVVAATTRIQPFVVGDGATSLKDLVRSKQNIRETNGYLSRMPIVADPARLRRSGLTMESIPPADQVVVLNDAANIHQGGENVDITDALNPSLAALAVAAARAIPGMGCGGVDLIADVPADDSSAAVLEVNAAANISVHHIPAYGEPVEVAAAIVEEMLVSARETERRN